MTVLVLAGTREGREVAAGLAARSIPVLASLAGRTRRPLEPGVPLRTGGFGGAQGFRDTVAAQGITAVIDATHPFAEEITERTARLCREDGLPHLILRRPGWQPLPGDDWTRIAREADLAAHVPRGATVFLATGPQRLVAFTGLEDRRVLCRRIDPAPGPFPYENGDWVVSRPPFSVEDETALFALLGVDVLATKNSGGEDGRAKLEAARALGLRVVLLDRPRLPEGALVVETVEEALNWAEGL
ncbi:precorrin-6A/cobalt-precorrin-6A reductase [Limimaricola soesokkakensis]|uniref:Precorrin-6A reductase n=1 Tax=Limimaricola soesokkakensis TaxID=1343159 RepID=A0A1X6ZZ17_9RHOB|nr:cobalt-precorrin-6A reductase [Limimaricola soesokkakensis]PSK83474.1 precorrin-6A/cobalt-precorrin-6A reductase [Limimaricola soesokkakensis]SLN63947.1 Precorrin-6A reductase [Limimaricola soesokkakensis]